ncbi:MAG TPA: hypothetical protein VFT98_08015 [Myxococcota bacterium]|nr:hypothetical protein [Myxococcota bacterium]
MLNATRRQGLFFVAVASLGLGFADAASAALLAYEPFEFGDVAVPSEGQYALGDENAGTNLLGGQDPTIGPTAFYGGAWIQSGGDSQAVKALPSLAYPMFAPGVGGVQQETIQFACCSFGRTGREIAGGLGAGREDRTVYESFLIDFGTQGTDDPTQFGFRGHELWNGAIGDSTRTVALIVNHFAGINELSLIVSTASGTTTVAVAGGGLDLPTLALQNGGTHLVVMRYSFSADGADAVAVFFDPTSSVEPLVPDASVSVAASDLAITHHGAFTGFTFSGAGHVPGAIDEIRWGDTFADVTPFIVPEPSMHALLGVGLACLAAARRGRTRR